MAKKRGLHGFTVQEAENAGLGQAGFDYISDTATHTGEWYAIKVVDGAAAVFAVLNTALGDGAAGLTIQEGDIVYGPFTSIKLTSGKVLAYRG